MVTQILTEEEKRAWSGFFVAHGKLTKEIDKELKKAGCVSMDVYDVLVTLELAPEERLKMSSLADRVLLTRSGMTRVVDRLEKLGYLKRVSCPEDRRAIYIVLTEKGRHEREKAWQVYQQGVKQRFVSYLSTEDICHFGELFWQIANGVEKSSDLVSL